MFKILLVCISHTLYRATLNLRRFYNVTIKTLIVPAPSDPSRVLARLQ